MMKYMFHSQHKMEINVFMYVHDTLKSVIWNHIVIILVTETLLRAVSQICNCKSQVQSAISLWAINKF